MSFMEGKRVKAVEGIPVSEAEVLQEVAKDVEKGERKKKGEMKKLAKEKPKGEELNTEKGTVKHDTIVR